MRGYLLGDFELAAILQISRDTGSSESVAPNAGADAGGEPPVAGSCGARPAAAWGCA